MNYSASQYSVGGKQYSGCCMYSSALGENSSLVYQAKGTIIMTEHYHRVYKDMKKILALQRNHIFA